MKETEKKKYPIGADNYELLEEIGQGVSAHVHRARCIPLNEIVAIKVLDFERENCDLNNVFREAQTMTLVNHPNVLKSHCSFVSDHDLWVVMPYMAGGSCLHILKSGHPDGFDEPIIATILREVLKGLEYLHHHGHIHRDVKAGNILIGARGAIKLGDFGVSACLYDSGDRQRTRNTFVGTPCWMAPEVMEQLHGYDFKADIWSFGITAFELAHGHAPFSKYPPLKVLMMTLQNAPPGLDYERDKNFSGSFKKMIVNCLVKDPSKRPTASDLLKYSFFKQARSSDYISRKLLEGLPDLGDRIKALKMKEESMVANKQMPDGRKEEISQNEYKRGISGWNFNIEDIKAQASLMHDNDDAISEINSGESSSSVAANHVQEKQSQCLNHSQIVDMEDKEEIRNESASVAVTDCTISDSKARSEKSNDDSIPSLSHGHHSTRSASPSLEDEMVDLKLSEKCDMENGGRQVEHAHSFHRRTPSGILPEVIPIGENIQNPPHSISTSNATALPLSVEANSDDGDENVRAPVVQQRGRFKVTSEFELEKVAPTPLLQKSQSMQVISSHNVTPIPSMSPLSLAPEAPSPNLSGSSTYQLLLNMLQANIEQRDNILHLMKQTVANHLTVDGASNQSASVMEKSLLESSHEREKDLLLEVVELHKSLQKAQDEIKKLKSEHTQV